MSNSSVFSMFDGLSTLWAIAAFVVAIGLLVTVHEFGHFWVARRCGVKVKCFSVGFGKKLWSRTDRHGTEFIIAMIPLGGYVKMLDGRVETVPASLQSQAFNNKPIRQRAAIIAAGPVANFIFAVLIYWIVYMLGTPAISPIVGGVTSNSIAQQANVPANVELKSIAGTSTTDWGAVRLALVGQIGNDVLPITFTPIGSTDVQSRTLNIQGWRIDLEKDDPIRSLGLQPKPITLSATLDKVLSGSAAERAGLKTDDKIVSYNDTPFTQWSDFADTIRRSPEQTLVLQIERNNATLTLPLLIDKKIVADGNIEGFAGIVPKAEGMLIQQYNPWQAMSKSVEQTWLMLKITVNSFGQLMTGVFDLNNLAGPVSIAKGAGQSASYGLVPYLTFLAFISISLGVINLFPLPVLDGGHLVFLLIEKIKGSPLSDRIQEMCFRVGSILLIFLMGFTLFNDFSRL